MKRYNEAARVRAGDRPRQAEAGTASCGLLLLLSRPTRAGRELARGEGRSSRRLRSPDQPLILNFLGYGQARARRGPRRRRGDDPQGQRACAGRCIDHRSARLGAVQARRRSTRRSRRSSGAEDPDAGGDPRASRATRCSSPGAGSRRATRGGGADRPPRRTSPPAQGQARSRPDPGQRRALIAAARDIAPAKLNLALHVRGKLPDGRHAIETIFAFCTDGDRLSASDADELSLRSIGPFARAMLAEDNLVVKAARTLGGAAGRSGATDHLDKKLPVASGIGGGSADAAATLRLLTRCGASIRACARSGAIAGQRRARLPAQPAERGEGAGDHLSWSTGRTVRDAGAAGQSARSSFDRRGISRLGRRRSRPARRLARKAMTSKPGTIGSFRQIGDGTGLAARDQAARPSSACPARAPPASPCSTARKLATAPLRRSPRMVASGDLLALRGAADDAPRPILTAERCALPSSGDRCRHQRSRR